MNIKAIQEAVHENALNKGWWDKEPHFPEIIALCHSELSEALEEYRNGRPALYYPCNAGGLCDKDNCGSKTYNPDLPDECSAQSKKPEGIGIELADVVIRIMDYCEHAGIDLEKAILEKHAYNQTRPYRHGGKVI